MAKLTINQARVLEDISRNEPVHAERIDRRTLRSLEKRGFVNVVPSEGAILTAVRASKDEKFTDLQQETYERVRSTGQDGARANQFRSAVVTSLVKRGILSRKDGQNVVLTADGQAMLGVANRMVLEDATAMAANA